MLSECMLEAKQGSTAGENESWFLVVPQNCGVMGSELCRSPASPGSPPSPHLWLPHPPSHSPPHLPILSPIAPQCWPVSNYPPSWSRPALSSSKPQESRALTCLIQRCTPRRGPGQWQSLDGLDGGMLMSSGPPVLRQRTSQRAAYQPLGCSLPLTGCSSLLSNNWG